MSLKAVLVSLTVLGLALSSTAQAAVVRGKVIRAEGRLNSSCRMVGLRRSDDNSITYFRITSGVGGDAILSIALSALLTRTEVEIQYSAAASTCGSEPDIEIIAVLAP
ncbi:hypothetical protein SAMN02799626_04697 [Caulobacter sp. UNC279MFTsu5.1]|nr:hypothetical protein SAMN02799626_04697 [Caulobacter sp. UNC279MFTsu5.1]